MARKYVLMKMILSLSLLLLAFAADAKPSNLAVEMMDEIERMVVLPKGAHTLDEYGRNYAFVGKEMVQGTYLLPITPPVLGEGCEVMLDNFDTRPCTKKENAQMAKSFELSAETRALPGTRRWFSHHSELPFIDDGGCMQVNVIFDTRLHQIISVSCNGHA